MKDSDNESIFVSFNDLKQILPNSDQMGFEKLFGEIRKRSNGQISYRIKNEKFKIPTSALHEDGLPRYYDPVPTGFEVHIPNVSKLDEYLIPKDERTRFDADTSRFYIRGIAIKIKKFGDEYHCLRIIFESPEETNKEWFFSEIAEKIDPIRPKEKRYQNALYQLKQKTIINGFSDFFITTSHSVKINPSYLS